MVRVPQAGIDLIKTFEGSRLEAYPDPKTGGLPITIGWGSTRKRDGRPFQLGERISQQDADALLLWQLEREFLPPLERIPGWQRLNADQQGAILSFAYNLGANFYNARGFETISRVLREQDWQTIERALVLYRNPRTNVEEGLLRRRLSEAEVFLASTPRASLSASARQYLAGGRTPSDHGNLSREAQAYLSAGEEGTGPGTVEGSEAEQRPLRLTTPPIRGQDVQAVQRSLARKGFAVIADGIFGPATARAVTDFQRRNGLVADGIVGPKTRELLRDRLLVLTTPNLVGDDVRVLQNALQRSGFPVVVDGILGPGTERAVRQFQASRGLVVDGVVGAQTWAQLGVG